MRKIVYFKRNKNYEIFRNTFKKKYIRTIWRNQSSPRVAMASCSNSTWMEPDVQPSIPAGCPDLSFCHLLTVHSHRPRLPATAPAPQSLLSSVSHHDNHVHIAGAPELPPRLRGRHQPPDQPWALPFPHLPVHVLLFWPQWWGFEELCQLFSSPISLEEGTC